MSGRSKSLSIFLHGFVTTEQNDDNLLHNLLQFLFFGEAGHLGIVYII